MTHFILASSSPRRVELLHMLLDDFEVATSNVEETGSGLQPENPPTPLSLPSDFAVSPADHPTLWAWRKALDVAQREHGDGDRLILGADTIVIAPGAVLGKPATSERARAMLAALRGRDHFVATGYALLHTDGSTITTLFSGAVVSTVLMRDYSDTKLEGYVATGEPMDKAGAYAVQGLGSALVSRVEGCYYNVVGLPVCEIQDLLVKRGALPAHAARHFCDFCPLRNRTAGASL